MKNRKVILILTVMLTLVFSPFVQAADAPVPPTPPASPYETAKTEEPIEASTLAPVPDETPTLPKESNVEAPSLTEEALDTATEPTDQKTTVTNENTGDDSENTGSLNQENDTETNINNEAKVENNVSTKAETGENEASYNTGNGTINTGDSNVLLNLLNLINTSFVSGSTGEVVFFFKNIYGKLFGNYIIDPFTKEAYSLNGSRINLSNLDTGSDSKNNVVYDQSNNTGVSVANDGNLVNNIDLSSNSGNNQASYNTGNGSIKTGDANIALNLFNMLNSTFISDGGGLVGILNVFGDWFGNLVLPSGLFSEKESVVSVANNNTGADSGNAADANLANNTETEINNDGQIKNEIDITSETGNNEGSYNTGNGTVKTGNSKSQVNLSNIANQTFVGDFVFYILVNVVGKWEGSNLLPDWLKAIVISDEGGTGTSILLTNMNTGASSDNTVSGELSNSNQNEITNKGTINNNLNLSANTGGNNASYNTGNGNVETGDSNVLANVFNLANVNVVSKKFVFVVLNIFGDWFGDITQEKEVPKNDDNKDNPISVTGFVITGTVKKVISPMRNKVKNVFYPQSTPEETEGTLSEGADISSNNLAKGSVLGKEDFNPTLEKTWLAKAKPYLVVLLVVYLGFLSVYFKKGSLKKK